MISIATNYGIHKKLINFLLLLVTLSTCNIYSQADTPSPSIIVTDNQGNEEITVDCDYPVDADRCFELVADFTSVNETVSYEVSGVTYADPITSLTEDQIVSVADDDRWSGVLDIPFTFCFYNDNHTQFVLSDNGVVTFDTSVASLESQYIRSQLPNGSLSQNAIFGVFHDMVNVTRNGCFDDPGTPENECGEIKLYTVGAAPLRSFIISYEGMNHFDCEDVKSTSQIVLYETSNIIEVYVQEKPVNCEVINAGDNPAVISGIQSRKNALIGIQNQDSSNGVIPPDRNNTEWSTMNEAWRFTPSGSPLTQIVWTDGAGLPIGTEETLKVCPEVSTTYTATITYDVCVGDDQSIADSIPITISNEFPVASDIVTAICDEPNFVEEMVNLTEFEAELIGTQTGLLITYHENENQARDGTTAIPDPTNYLLNRPTKTIYARLQRGVSCFDVGTILLDLTPVGVPQISSIVVCDEGNDSTELLDLTDYDDQIIGTQAGMNISYHFSKNEADTNSNPQTELNAVPGSEVFVRFSIGIEETCPYVTRLETTFVNKPDVITIEEEVCDDLQLHDLTAYEDQIEDINTFPLEFSYHIRALDALRNIRPIDDPDTDDVNEAEQYIHDFKVRSSLIIYARVNAQGSEGCFSTYAIELTGIEGIVVTDEQLVANNGGFNLTESYQAILDANPQISIEYIDCITELPITDPANYSIPGGGFEENICVILTNNDSGCTSDPGIGLLDSGGRERLGPDGGRAAACDPEGDGMETFILSDFIPEIIENVEFANPDFKESASALGLDLITVTFFDNEPDANSNTNEIIEKTITTTTTIFIRVSIVFEGEEIAGSEFVAPFILEFKPSTTFQEITKGICDVRSNNSETVDLTIYQDEILDGETGDFTYFDEADEEITIPETYFFRGPTKEVKVIITTPDGCDNETKITLEFDDQIPVVNTTLFECDFENDRIEVFDLNEALPNISVDYMNFTASYYISQRNADDQIDAFSDPTIYELDRTSRRVYVRLEDVGGCYNTTFIDLRIVSTPTFRTTTIELCDVGNDNIETARELSDFDSTISSTLFRVTVVYYPTEQDAIDETNVVEQLDITPTTILYANLKASTGDCIVTEQITFNFLPTPVVNDIPVIVCDNENDNSEIYDVTQHETDAVVDLTDKNITYYRTLDEAEREVNRITNTTVYPITVVPQIVYMRVEDSNTGCFSIANLNIEFTQPVAVTDVSLETCDIAADGSEIFDATSKLSEMISNPDDFEITYYTSNDAASEGDITSPFFVRNPEEVDTVVADKVFVRFYEVGRGCYTVGEVSLILLNTPKLTLGNFEICDTDFDGKFTLSLPEINEEVINNTSGLTFSYFNSFDDADNNIDSIQNPENYEVETSPEVVFVRVEGDNGCFSVSTVDIIIDQRVVVEEVTEALKVCDDDRDMFTVFNLTSFENRFTNETGATFKYYNTQDDVNNQTNEILIPTAYQNSIEDKEEIFVRVFVDEKCDDFTAFMIETIRIEPNLEDVSFCDGDTATLDGGDGFVSYLWNTGATTRTIDITDGGEYTVTLENDQGCLQTFPITATKLPLPIINDTNFLDECDDDGTKDGFTSFTIANAINEITLDDNTLEINFYSNQTDFDNETNAVDTNNFINTSNPQTLLAKVTNIDTGCFSSAQLTLRVNLIEANNTTIEVCDDDLTEDGIYNFTLSDADTDVANGVTFDNITYYINETDALSGANPLTDSYTNSTPNNQIVFARIEKTENNKTCFDVSEISLIVNELPGIELTEEYIYCQNFFPETIELNSGISQAEISEYSYEWSTGATTSSIDVNEIGEYNVTVTFIETDCEKTKIITVNPTMVDVVTLPPIEKCDTTGEVDGNTVFVLNDLNNDLTNNDNSLNVSYFLSEEDAVNTVSQLNDNSFINTENPQTIYAKVLNSEFGCYAITPITLQVNFIISNVAMLETCDLLETAEGVAIFDLSLANQEITDGLSTNGDIPQYFENFEDAELLQNQLDITYTNNTAFSQEIYSRIVSNDGCVGIGKVLLIVNDLPNIPNQETVTYCIDTFPDTITLTSGVINPNEHTFNWSNGATSAEIEINEAGIYTVEVTTNKGCKKEQTIVVISSEKPIIDRVEIGDERKINNITIFASGIGEYEYSLDNISYQESNFFGQIEAGFYTVYVRDINNCGITEENIAVLGLPKFFSPNNDGINDLWRPIGLSNEFQEDVQIYVFDRFGKLLKQINSLNNNDGWDGTFTGKNLPSTDYWYTMSYIEIFSGQTREITGHFSLIR